MRLKIKHIAPYLPRGIYIKNKKIEIGVFYEVRKLIGIYSSRDLVVHSMHTICDFWDIKNCLPLLKPLDELKDVVGIAMSEINTDTLIAIEISEFANKKISLRNLSHAAYEELMRHHYDIFDLFQNGLAEIYDVNMCQK